jgi:Porin PorA
MRRDVGLMLAGLGVFLVVAAVSLPAYINARVIKFPLNEFETATLTGSNVQYFSSKALTEETGVTVRASYTIKGAGSAGNSTTSVWDEVQYSYDVTNGQVQDFSTRRAAFDRKTAQIVNCCGANINNHVVRQSGIIGWVFPFGTKKQTYQVFDTTLNKPEPFVFSGTDTTDGVQTYKFVEDVPPTQFASLTVPGYFVGSSAQSISAPEFYQTHVIYWVDPETGALLNVNNSEELTVRNPATGVTGLVLYKGDLIMTPASLQTIVNLDKNGRNELFLLTTLLPIVLGIGGAAVLIAGILLARKRGPGGAAVMPLSAMAPPAAADAVPSSAATGAPSAADPAATDGTGTS